ncbi:hypothetical protein [Cellulomonas sp. PSBB021]|uniref:hypothetical protein n=1 Tax=Cellulomonas sp. PSBB021 TaxID=2003551 RepID=UPI000B8D59EB|nr:hypothetical protein [Cellulomonas sp. PSBB021]ASR54198.1 hypothetical protein CBP52_02480 [Cellulomonas sp. PSBB021]
MTTTDRALPTPTPDPSGFVTMAALAQQWGIARSTLRTALGTWLPAPDATIGTAHVWRPESLAGLERPAIGRPVGARDRKPRTRRPSAEPASSSAPSTP